MKVNVEAQSEGKDKKVLVLTSVESQHAVLESPSS